MHSWASVGHSLQIRRIFGVFFFKCRSYLYVPSHTGIFSCKREQRKYSCTSGGIEGRVLLIWHLAGTLDKLYAYLELSSLIGEHLVGHRPRLALYHEKEGKECAS